MPQDLNRIIEEVADKKPGSSGYLQLLTRLASMAKRAIDIVPPHWSPARDIALGEFWRDDGAYLSSFMAAAVNQVANIGISVKPKDYGISAHIDQAERMTEQLGIVSEYGEGLHTTMVKFLQDWLGTDNGAFMEIMGDGPADGPIQGPVIAVRHIDSLSCRRTGDPIYPVVVAEGGRLYKVHYTRVFFSSQLASSRRELFGVGYSSVSRSLRIAYDLFSTLNAKAEKKGSRPQRLMLVGNNITGEEILTSFTIAEEVMSAMGLENFAKIVAIGGTDVSVDRVELTSVDGIDVEKELETGLVALAHAWNMDVSEILPVSTAANASAGALLARSRGRLPTTFKAHVEKQLGFKLLPRHLYLSFDQSDDAADQQKAVIEDIWARLAQRNLKSGASVPFVEWSRSVRRGAITQDEFRYMCLGSGILENGQPVETIFFNSMYANEFPFIQPDWLIVNNNTDAAEAIITAVQTNKLLALNNVANTRGAKRRRAEEAHAALTWLENKYKTAFDERQQVIINSIESMQNNMQQLNSGGSENEDGGMNAQ